MNESEVFFNETIVWVYMYSKFRNKKKNEKERNTRYTQEWPWKRPPSLADRLRVHYHKQSTTTTPPTRIKILDQLVY